MPEAHVTRVIRLGHIALVVTVLLAACAAPNARQIPYGTEAAGIFLDAPPHLLHPQPRTALRPVSTRALELTTSTEGFRPLPYSDPATYCTVAYGHLLAQRPCGIPELSLFPSPLSRTDGLRMLTGDMRMAEAVVANDVEIELTDGQYGALCDFVYNVGGNRFDHSNLLQVVNRKEFALVPGELSRWVIAGGKRLNGLVRRRKLEAALFLSDSPVPREAIPPSTSPDIDIYTGDAVKE